MKVGKGGKGGRGGGLPPLAQRDPGHSGRDILQLCRLAGHHLAALPTQQQPPAGSEPPAGEPSSANLVPGAPAWRGCVCVWVWVGGGAAGEPVAQGNFPTCKCIRLGAARDVQLAALYRDLVHLEQPARSVVGPSRSLPQPRVRVGLRRDNALTQSARHVVRNGVPSCEDR